jgi:hypothetical protein
LDEELFISLATLSEYVRVAEHADSMARKAGKMVDIDSEPTVDMEFDVDTSSSQESTLPDEINEDVSLTGMHLSQACISHRHTSLIGMHLL